MEFDSYSEKVHEEYQDIIQSLYDLEDEINEYIDLAYDEGDEEEVTRLTRELNDVERMIACAFNL